VTSEERKFYDFGLMIFGMMTDVLLLPEGDAYARKSVTMPDGREGKHRLALIVARQNTADAMEEIASRRFNIQDIKGTGGERS
jgi:hypothetical protein